MSTKTHVLETQKTLQKPYFLEKRSKFEFETFAQNDQNGNYKQPTCLRRLTSGAQLFHQ